MTMKKILKEFNKPDTILVVSGWPVKDKLGERNHGMAWYTKETAEKLALNYKRRVVVLAENGRGEKVEQYARGKIVVLRVFGDKGVSLYPVILTWLARFSQVKKVYVHSEFGATFGLKHFILLPAFLALIRMSGREIVYFAHNVIDDIRTIAGQVNVPVVPGLTWGLNQILKVYYWSIANLVAQIVVLEESIGERLGKVVNTGKLAVAPLVIEPKRRMAKVFAKKQLGYRPKDVVVVYFGFVSWYKGADWLVKAFSKLARKPQFRSMELLIAGGPAYSLKDRAHYQDFYQEVSDVIASDSRMKLSGFVPEDKIALYMSAADVVVLPYRGLMGASGTLAQALGYGTPVLVSTEMVGVFGSQGLTQALEKSGLALKDVSFGLNQRSFERVMIRAKKKYYLGKLAWFVRIYRSFRSAEKLAAFEYEYVYRQGSSGVDVVEHKGRMYDRSLAAIR